MIKLQLIIYVIIIHEKSITLINIFKIIIKFYKKIMTLIYSFYTKLSYKYSVYTHKRIGGKYSVYTHKRIGGKGVSESPKFLNTPPLHTHTHTHKRKFPLNTRTHARTHTHTHKRKFPLILRNRLTKISKYMPKDNQSLIKIKECLYMMDQNSINLYH